MRFFLKRKRDKHNKHRRWLLVDGTHSKINENDVRVMTYPPTPKEQNMRIGQWMQDHQPTFTEGAQLAPRWTEENRLHIEIPKGLTRYQKHTLHQSIQQLVNMIYGLHDLKAPPEMEIAPDELHTQTASA